MLTGTKQHLEVCPAVWNALSAPDLEKADALCQ